MAADTFGRPIRFILTAGQSGDALAAPALLGGFRPSAVLADKAYDSNALRQLIAEAGAEAVIPSNRTRKVLIAHDIEAYRARNRIERCFSKLKHFRRFATRYDRRAIHFLGFVHLAATMIWRRFFALAKPIAASAIVCSFWPRQVGSWSCTCSSASDRQVTLPWPKMPNTPANSGTRVPSISVNWLQR